MSTPGGRRSGREKTVWAVGLVVVVVYALLPVAWMVSLSLKPADEVSTGGFWPQDPTFENYVGENGVFKDPQFPAALRNSLGIALIATVLAVLLATFAAYAIVRLDFPGKALVLSGALAIAMFPPVAIIGPLFDMWRSIGLFDTWPGLIIPYMTFTLPLAIWTLSAFFREIPWDLDRAARVDGATPFQAFRRVIAPLAAPGMFTSAILVFIFAWNDFLFATSLTSTNRARTVPAAITFFTGASQFTFPTGQIAAASVIVTIPIIVMVLIFQRRIVAGLTSGAVKG
ncbi:carbohydrate ABC transporter permease [Iamia majanohamensis]|uniref:Carbohydrate ABC transporter permease n=1 Tax=Iamia majanohamensis TaxID=467976 RepID=A0AAE9Y6H9_9ACTN|nr:carbohydrate ABC transporter permease [Iamia majanohamensis]WCO65203.1 carbohydrate ABC transporter permease [Iamia majanohamensis]